MEDFITLLLCLWRAFKGMPGIGRGAGVFDYSLGQAYRELILGKRAG